MSPSLSPSLSLSLARGGGCRCLTLKLS
jgi:hypothetical protein